MQLKNELLLINLHKINYVKDHENFLFGLVYTTDHQAIPSISVLGKKCLVHVTTKWVFCSDNDMERVELLI